MYFVCIFQAACGESKKNFFVSDICRIDRGEIKSLIDGKFSAKLTDLL